MSDIRPLYDPTEDPNEQKRYAEKIRRQNEVATELGVSPQQLIEDINRMAKFNKKNA